jgi:hypothetical protein
MKNVKFPLLFVFAVAVVWTVSSNPASSSEADEATKSAAAEPSEPAPTAIQAWDYITVAAYPPDGLGAITRSGKWRTFIDSRPVEGHWQDALDALGRKGWEAVGYSHGDSSHWVLLKRPL